MELPTPTQFFAALIFWAVAAMLVFRHAERRGNPKATHWGIATFLLGVVALPAYFIRYWMRTRR